MRKEPMRRSDYIEWLSFPDGHYKQKKVGRFIVELYYGTERGGMILLWSARHDDRMYMASSSSTDRRYFIFDEVHFMFAENAQAEYRYLEKVSDVIELAWRNM